MTKSELITKLTEALELAKQLPDEPVPTTDPWRGKWSGPDPLPQDEPPIKETIRPVGDPVWVIERSGHYDLDVDINSPHRFAIVPGAPDIFIHGNGHVVQSAGAPNPRNAQCAVNVVHLFSSNSNPDDSEAGLSGLQRANDCTISDLTIRANNADTRFFQAVGGYSVVGTKLENCTLEGRGMDGRAFGLRYGGLMANNCIFISRMHDTVNRHQSPACIQAGRVVLDQCVIYGGSGGIYIQGTKGSMSEITRCVIANVGIGANAYGLMRGARVKAWDNVFLAVHGLGARGILIQDEARFNEYKDNVMLCFNRGTDEFAQQGQYASGLRFRNGATGVVFKRNYVLCLGGGPEGSDSDFRYAVPVRSTITSGMGRNFIRGNYLGALTTDPPGELMHHQGLKGAACLGFHDKTFPTESQVIDDNILESNGYVFSLSGWEGTAHQSGSQRNNKIVRNRTPHDMIAAFKLARDKKLQHIEMAGNLWAEWITEENNRVLDQYAEHFSGPWINNPVLIHTGAREGDERITILGSGEATLTDCQPRNEQASGKRYIAVGASAPERWFGRDTDTGPYAEHEGPPPAI